jgi:carboxypeptidase C (cathepsin A)
MRRFALCLLVLLVPGMGLSAPADEKAAEASKPSPEAAKAEPPKSEQSVTRHSVSIGGAPVGYTATAGTLVVRTEKDAPWASIGYVAYTRNDAADPARRPLTFAYNGGPGSSSIWLHMGVLGPRRIVTSEAAATPPPPYKVVDNEYSILDRTDLVMIDPVGTGLSKAVGEAKDKDFWGVDPDIASLSRFIVQYVSEHDRWNSPKYLLGESYGTTRSGGIVDRLQAREGMSFNGVILVSLALDLGAIFDELPGNERPYPFFLPSYAAVTWYHKVLPNRPAELGPFLDEVRRFALGPYASALMQGHDLPVAERQEILRKLHAYTGLSESYLDKADLRVTEAQFTQELLREHRETVGRLDARFLGVAFDPLAEKADYDPQEAAIAGAFSAAFLDYYHRELKFGRDRTYRIGADLWKDWDYKHKVGGSEFPQPMVDTSLDLAHAMGYNPHLKVLVLQGLYDLATPTLATEWVVSHMNLTKEQRPRIEIKYYDAGHMMYVHGPDLKKFREDVVAFIDSTDRL